MISRALRIAGGICTTFALLGLSGAGQAQIFNDVDAELRLNWLRMKRELPRHPNPEAQRFAECIARDIIRNVPDEYQDLDWEIIVFDSESANASVTPEGKIAVFSGILQVADTPDKLAAVLGHEVAHLTQGHVGERVRRAAMTGVAGLAVGTITGFGNESQQGAQVVMQLPFQRKQENDADIAGMMLMAKSGYNPTVTIEIWRKFAAESGPRSELLSTHPDPELRMREIAANLTPALQAYNAALDAGVRANCYF